MRQAVGIVGSCVMLLVIAACSKPPAVSGRELYAGNCASCHGRYADGEGPAAADVSAPVPDLRYLAARNGGVFPRPWVADVIDGRDIVKAHGSRQMPVWGDAFAEIDDANGSVEAQTAAKITALVDYLAEIQQSH
jgi:mono/diheme cytochrome c family protein